MSDDLNTLRDLYIKDVRARIQDLGYVVDRLHWLSFTDNLSMVLDCVKRYEGRGGSESAWWDDELNSTISSRTLPPYALHVNTHAGTVAPWDNAFHLRNSKTGAAPITQFYIKPKVEPNEAWLFRFDMFCPTEAAMPVGADAVFIGFEIPFQGGNAIYWLQMSKAYVGIGYSLQSPTGAFVNGASADISAWVCNAWKAFYLIVDPWKKRLTLCDHLGNTVTVAIDPSIVFFPKVSPFMCNECTAVLFPGIYVGEYAIWHIVPDEIPTVDSGLHTNPEKWLHDNHWDCNEVTVAVAGVGGQQNLGAAVGATLERRIREITIRHAGTNNTVVTLLIAAGATRVTVDVPAQSTRTWSSQDGRVFTAAQQPAVQSSDITAGNTFISAAGVEAAP